MRDDSEKGQKQVTVHNFGGSNDLFVQQALGASVRGDIFNFNGGNDRLILLRNDDFAGLGDGPVTFGAANMGDGRDVVITSFNMSGTFNLGTGNDAFVSDGNDSFNFTDIHVFGGAGFDLIAATTLNGDYRGEAGNDLFVSDGSNNFFDGGDGNDTYSAELAETQTSIDLLEGKAFGRFNLDFDSLSNIENVRGSAQRDIIFGNNGNNRIDGLAGNDDIDGDPGNDTISGGAGTNNLFGNIGTDTLVITGNVTSKSGTAGNFTVNGTLASGAAFTHFANGFEQVLLNGVLMTSARFLNPNAANATVNTVIGETPAMFFVNGYVAGQTLNGNDNPNTINGGAGFDDIDGRGGSDVLRGFGGEDHLFGRGGLDTLEGGDHNDVLIGEIGDDILRGGNGNDQLFGGADNDTLVGGANADVFFFTSPFNAANADVIVDYSVADDSIRISASLVGLAAGPLAAVRFKDTSDGAVDGDDRIIYDNATGNLFFDSNGSGTGSRVLIADLAANLVMTSAEIILL